MATTLVLPAERSRNWSELPAELLTSILLRGGAFHVLIGRRVCKAWRRVCSNPDLWRVLDLRCSGYGYGRPLETMGRLAVDLSCGQLVDLTIAFGLLIVCFFISRNGLIEVVKRLPLLEELHFYRISISGKVIEVAGQCCPQLKSFKLDNSHKGREYLWCDEEARAVAENMPELRHLKLIANTMRKEGLQAILDNCPHLESLDIRQCSNLKLDLLRSLSQEMKDLMLTYDTEAEQKPMEIF